MGNSGISNHRLLWWFTLIFFVLLPLKFIECKFRNFVLVNTLNDGEIETRICYKKICAKETTVGKGFGSLKYRQLVRENNLLQLIYEDSNTLTDCDYVQDGKLSKTFLDNFKKDVNTLTTSNHNETFFRHFHSSTISSRSSPYSWMDFGRMRRQCRELHTKIRERADNSSSSTLDNSSIRIRERRDLGDFLRIPGTKWCGKGYSAEKYTRLGLFSKTDRCCRKHDTSCPFWIGGFSTKYGLYNWRVNTIMHCGCDERFRACLKLVGTSDANVVGKLFFNVVQTQCFIIKYKKRCVKRSWWGKCEKHKFVKHAILRNNLPY